MNNRSRRILAFWFFVIAFAPMYAQRNLKWFSGKTPDEIISAYGEPLEKNLDGSEYSDYMVDCYMRIIALLSQ